MFINSINHHSSHTKNSFKADAPNASATTPVASEALIETLPSQPAQPKAGIIHKSVNFFRSLCKLNVAAQSYTGGFIQGLVQGFVAGGIVMSGAWILSSAAKVGSKDQKIVSVLVAPFKLLAHSVSYATKGLWRLPNATIKQLALFVVKAPLNMAKAVYHNKNISRFGKIATFTTFGGVFAYNMMRSVLYANQRKAEIDHKLVNTPIFDK